MRVLTPSGLLLSDGGSNILDVDDVLVFLVLIFTSRGIHQNHLLLLLVNLQSLLLLDYMLLLLLQRQILFARTWPLNMSLLTPIIIVDLNSSFVMLKLEQGWNRCLYVTPLVLLIILRLITTQLMLLALQLGVCQHEPLRLLLVGDSATAGLLLIGQLIYMLITIFT